MMTEEQHITNVQRAIFLFRSGYNCSQSIFSTFGPLLGLDEDTCLKIACPFGGGIARLGNVCGAVSGALMVIGLCHGKGVDDEEECKIHSYALVQNFLDTFKSQHGSIICRELIGYDISSEAGHERAKNEGIFAQKCESYVVSSAEILEKLLAL
jgi:C_GCAxxG_C_C family probable redox protein